MASAGRGLAVVALAVGGAGAAGKTAWEALALALALVLALVPALVQVLLQC